MPDLGDYVLRGAVFESTKKLLVSLAINYTPETQWMEVPRGTTTKKFNRLDFYKFDPSQESRPPRVFDDFFVKPVEDIVRLEPFFGLMVGYYEYGNVIVFWPLI